MEICARTEAEVGTAAAHLGKRALGVVRDTANHRNCARMVKDTVARFGRPDILVNIFKPLVEMSVEEWRLRVDVTLGGIFLPCEGSAPLPRGEW